MSVDQASPCIRDGYRAESSQVIASRFAVTTTLFTIFMGLGAAIEATFYPVRAQRSYALWGLEALAAIVGTIALRVPRCIPHSRGIGIATSAVVAMLVATYHGSVGALAERLTNILGCILNLMGAVVPWGMGPQIVLTAIVLGSFAAATPFLQPSESLFFPATVLVAAATTSICSAFFVDRHRFDAFRRAAMQTEETEIAASLARVSETLSRSLGSAGVPHDVVRLAVDVLRTDFASLFLFDERCEAFRLASSLGGRAEVEADLAELEFRPGDMPIFDALKPGRLVEIPDADTQEFVPPALLARLETPSLIAAPMLRGQQVVGVLVAGYRERKGAFSPRQRRLSLGIANAAAVALENVRLVADLQAANRLKSEFVATMSHELRTPINVIIGYTEMLSDGGIAPDDAAGVSDTLRRIHRSARELLELVGATLDMGRLESGREVVTVDSIDVGELLAEIARESEPIVPRGVTLTWHSALRDVRVVTDRTKLKTIVKNLVGNACKFTHAGSIHMDAHRADGGIVVAVRDSGIGIAPEHLPVIFEMFRQVDSSYTRRHGGVGLGLHIARRLAHLLGGRLDVESRLGEGSTFVLVVPLREHTGAAIDARAVAA